jgi:hypothetical protein
VDLPLSCCARRVARARCQRRWGRLATVGHRMTPLGSGGCVPHRWAASTAPPATSARQYAAAKVACRAAIGGRGGRPGPWDACFRDPCFSFPRSVGPGTVYGLYAGHLRPACGGQRASKGQVCRPIIDTAGERRVRHRSGSCDGSHGGLRSAGWREGRTNATRPHWRTTRLSARETALFAGSA